jgi:ParB/RepB/Spo0J family partition protein
MSKDTEARMESPAETAMTILAPALMVRSRTNPRTHFDAAYIQELADSIRLHGVIQPILVRPLPADRLQDTFEDREPGAPLPSHEIVCGECRWRACKDAEVDGIPVLIRELDDLQVLQVQLVENLRRKDLHPLEEAEGFSRLMEEHHLKADDVATRVGRSESYVWKSLKLLELTPECRERLYAGKLTQSTALLVARQPGYLQEKIARDIMRADYPEGMAEPMSFREASRHIHQHYMLRLVQAPFDLADAALVPAAGDCKSCPKRTGANTALFEDIESADTCTDPKCFDGKKVAHFEQVAETAKAKGQKVIMGKEAHELMPHEGSLPKGYTLLDEKEYFQGEGYKSVRSVINKVAKGKDAPKPVLILDPHTKQLREALPTDVANKLVKKAQAEAKAPGSPKDKKQSARDLEQKIELAIEERVVESVHAALMGGKVQQMPVDVARVLCLRLADMALYNGPPRERFIRLFGVEGADVGARDAVADFLKNCPVDQVAPALLVILMEDEIGNDGLDLREGTAAQVITAACEVDVEAVKAEVKEALRAELQPEKPARKAGSQPKAKKASATEAKAGIAKAMQEQEESAAPAKAEIGSSVRILQGARPIHIRGRNGKLTTKVGDDWLVEIEDDKVRRLPLVHFEVLPSPSAAVLPADWKPSPDAAWPFPIDRKQGTSGDPA